VKVPLEAANDTAAIYQANMYLWIFKNASYANVHLGNLKIHVINLFGVAVICWVNTYPRRIIKPISQHWLLQMDTQLYLPFPQVMVTHSGSAVDIYVFGLFSAKLQ